MTRPLRTVLVGVGRMGATYANDARIARHYRYSSHAQVLADHPGYAWEAAVDPDAPALADARARWGLAHCASSVTDLLDRYDPEVLVLATPPSAYRAAIAACPGLKAVLCEKPLGSTLAEAQALLELCEARGILLQTNYWRRCDPFHRRLAAGHLAELVGRPAVINGLYGNGLLNNGSHLVDVCRMLFGEIAEVTTISPALRAGRLPLADDFDVGCMLDFVGGVTATLQPLDFTVYREVGLDIWGEAGRLELLNEGLTNRWSRRSSHRALNDAQEIRLDQSETLTSTVGEALFHVYENLFAALQGSDSLWSSGVSARGTAAVVEAIRRAAAIGDGRAQAVRNDR